MLTFKQFLREQAMTTTNGYLHFDWAKDFGDQSYIPAGASHTKVLELYPLKPEPNKAEALLKDFLATQEAKQADVIFIDEPGEHAAVLRAAGFTSSGKGAQLRLVRRGASSGSQSAA